jgi:hypothetical protein
MSHLGQSGYTANSGRGNLHLEMLRGEELDRLGEGSLVTSATETEVSYGPRRGNLIDLGGDFPGGESRFSPPRDHSTPGVQSSQDTLLGELAQSQIIAFQAIEKLTNVMGNMSVRNGDESHLMMGRALPLFKEAPKFDASSNSLSPLEFLEKLEAYVQMTNMSMDTFVHSRVAALFSGRAANWFRFKGSFSSFASFKDEFLKAFLCNNYKEMLWEELLKRTQDPREDLPSYIHAMNTFFELAKPEASQQERVARVMRQMHPYARLLLANCVCSDLAELEREAQRIQSVMYDQAKYKPPPSAAESLDRALAFKPTNNNLGFNVDSNKAIGSWSQQKQVDFQRPWKRDFKENNSNGSWKDRNWREEQKKEDDSSRQRSNSWNNRERSSSRERDHQHHNEQRSSRPPTPTPHPRSRTGFSPARSGSRERDQGSRSPKN